MHSAFVALGATAALLLVTSPAGASERRCGELGSNCVCSEPLNTPTHNGGRSSWTLAFDPDDSPDTSECAPTARGAESFCNDGLVPVSASGEPLPAGHSLTWVLKRTGGSICHIGHPDIHEAPDVSYCARAYRRWDQGSYIPAPGTGGNEQQKVLTIGGVDPNNLHNPVQNSSHDGGIIGTRFDSSWFETIPDFQSVGMMQDCQQNYCRFEICVDYRSTGKATARFRMTKLTGGPPVEWFVTKPEGKTARASWDWIAGGGGGLAFYGQGPGRYINYNTHFLIGKTRPANSNFWLGAACEVEGGCNGAPPPPPPPAPEPVGTPGKPMLVLP
jgi:hypothetical protein